MSTDQDIAYVPQWTQGDRLRKARATTGMTVREFAEHIGVSHGTVTSAETDARAVRPITFKAWAMATGVSLAWLETGEGEGDNPTPPTTGKRDDSALAALIAEKSARGGRSHTPGYSPFAPEMVPAA